MRKHFSAAVALVAVLGPAARWLFPSVSQPPVMRASTNPASGTVIGKAMGNVAAGTGVTAMLVMLR